MILFESKIWHELFYNKLRVKKTHVVCQQIFKLALLTLIHLFCCPLPMSSAPLKNKWARHYGGINPMMQLFGAPTCPVLNVSYGVIFSKLEKTGALKSN